jgi:hypothetical protein
VTELRITVDILTSADRRDLANALLRAAWSAVVEETRILLLGVVLEADERCSPTPMNWEGGHRGNFAQSLKRSPMPVAFSRSRPCLRTFPQRSRVVALAPGQMLSLDTTAAVDDAAAAIREAGR